MKKVLQGLGFIGLAWFCHLAVASTPISVSDLMKKYGQVTQSPQNLDKERNTIFVFVSFSMPKQSLTAWLGQAHQIGAPVIIRGLVNHSFNETLAKLKEVININNNGVSVNPPLFEKYHVEQVPAVVMVAPSGQYDVVYGNTSLSYALSLFKKSDNAIIQANASELAALLMGNKT